MAINRHALAAGAVVALLLLAGCGSIAGGGPSASSPEADVIDGTPVITFNYSVDDYTSVLLESPSGDVINEGTLEPNQSTGTLRMGEPVEGTYKIILQTGGETAAETSVSFNGSDASVETTSAVWERNSLQEAEVTVRNSGDLPMKVSEVALSTDDTTINEEYAYEWIAPGEEKRLSLSPSFESIEATERGTFEGTVIVGTSGGTVDGTFSKRFEGANLSITDTSAEWNGGNLETATVTVENSGDLPTEIEATIESSGTDPLATSDQIAIAPGESKTLELGSLGPIYESTGGNVSLPVVVNSSVGFETTKITHDVAPASVKLVSVNTEWRNGGLISVSYTVENTGDVATDFSVSFKTGGSEFGVSSQRIEGGSSATFTYSGTTYSNGPIFNAVSGGDFPVTVAIDSGDGSDSMTDTTTLGEPDVSVSGTDATFFDQYDSELTELSTLSFDIQSTGDIALVYDEVRITLDGSSRSKTLYSDTVVAPGGSETQYMTPSDSIAVEPGSYQMEIVLLFDGEEVASDTVTVSTGS
ncbi:hypothetical protein [Halolamina salifodinae]|uniref:CARDB domain-containing protein n=1 Tax=Halolamina salifodinae TaxID=1202767 RepID=A0A8T4GV51_9EURY|nr:hypothetical protein [Halolamina salifodinae]MBP1985953.1 hypothetical protein [Halolamina salifodinae]